MAIGGGFRPRIRRFAVPLPSPMLWGWAGGGVRRPPSVPPSGRGDDLTPLGPPMAIGGGFQPRIRRFAAPLPSLMLWGGAGGRVRRPTSVAPSGRGDFYCPARMRDRLNAPGERRSSVERAQDPAATLMSTAAESTGANRLARWSAQADRSALWLAQADRSALRLALELGPRSADWSATAVGGDGCWRRDAGDGGLVAVALVALGICSCGHAVIAAGR